MCHRCLIIRILLTLYFDFIAQIFCLFVIITHTIAAPIMQLSQILLQKIYTIKPNRQTLSYIYMRASHQYLFPPYCYFYCSSNKHRHLVWTHFLSPLSILGQYTSFLPEHSTHAQFKQSTNNLKSKYQRILRLQSRSGR